MASQQRPCRNADPFAVMPYSKSYYMPSPTKDVNKREAIQVPERKLTKSKREEAEERFIFGSDTVRASAMASGVQSLGRTEEFVVNTSECQTSLESGRLEESWPGSVESPNMTRHTEHDNSALTDSSNFNYDLGTKGISVEKQDVGNARLQDEPTESVLQRYIDRFRNSDPKPREERLKERMRQQQEFWWLRKASPALDRAAQRGQQQTARGSTSLSAPNTSARLTQEALQAMDEETLKLQTKADMLLSQSELSFASSDPIVSTEGLGTTRSSASVSDFSVMDDQVPYRPSFVRIQEKMYNSRSQSLPNHRAIQPGMQGPHTEGHHTEGPRSGAGDILSRWRLRRKMEDTPPTHPHGGARSAQFSSQSTSLDPRLEEFRKKLFSQKAAIIKQDIDFERQKMKLYLDDDDAKTVNMTASPEETQVSTTDEVADPILRRLRQVTGGSSGKTKVAANDSICYATYQSAHADIQNSICASTNIDSSRGVHHVNNSEYGSTDFQRNSNNRDFNSNNIQKDIFDDEIHKRGAISVEGLDVNNTALNEDDNSEGFDHDMGGVSVDVFDSQVICDPKKRVFSLHSSQNSIPIVSDMVQDISKQHSVDISSLSKNLKSKNNASLGNENVSPQSSGSLEHRNVKHSEVDCFHQVLEAEKPNEDSGQLKGTHGHMKREHDTSNNNSESRNKTKKKPLGSKSEVNDTRASDSHISKEKRNRNTKSKQHQFESDDESFVSNPSDIEETSIASSSKFKQDKKEDRRHQRALADSENMQPNKKPDKKDDKVSMFEKADLPALQPCSSPATTGKGTGRQPMQAAIGQTVADHLFDASVMMSSVDSWSSMFPQSPARSRTLHETVLCGEAPSPPRRDHSPKQSTPICKEQTIAEVPEDLDDSSEEEFTDDPLLALLRQQRSHYMEQLRQIELKLQEKDK